MIVCRISGTPKANSISPVAEALGVPSKSTQKLTDDCGDNGYDVCSPSTGNPADIHVCSRDWPREELTPSRHFSTRQFVLEVGRSTANGIASAKKLWECIADAGTDRGVACSGEQAHIYHLNQVT